MDGTKAITVSRQELYDRIWTTPVTELCREYGIRTADLVELCERHDIPRPPNGHWVKKLHGKSDPQRPLPPCDKPELQTVEIGPHVTTSGKSAPAFDADIAALLDKVRALSTIRVPANVSDLHPMVLAVRDRLKNATPDTHQLVSTPWYGDLLVEVAVGKESVSRAVRFMNTLLKAIEKIGGRIEVRPTGGLQRHETVSHLCGEAVSFRLRERYWQVAVTPGERDMSAPFARFSAPPRCGYVLTGEFVVDQGRGSCGRGYAEDTTDNARVEEKLNEILVALVTEAGNLRLQRGAREAEQKRHEDEARVRREQAEREREERTRVEKLLADAEAWRRVDVLRGFIGAVEQLASAKQVNGGEGPELVAWLKWARQQAAALDPVATTLDRLTNKCAG